MTLSKTLFVAAIATFSAAAQIPVNCGDALSTPGALYVLTGDLACPNAPAVHISADNVTFDLQGFTLAKSGAAVGAGITTTNIPSNVCQATTGVHILNGTVTHFGQ